MTIPPDPVERPSGRALLRSTIIAVLIAGALLVTCVLPAEYGKDPTGIGRALGLTQMGEVKLALAEEAANNAAAEASADSVIAAAEAGPQTSGEIASAGDSALSPIARARVDTSNLALQPGKGAEIKLVMPGGTRARYQWSVSNGVVNFDMHGDSTNAPKDWFISYRKGQRATGDSGELVAAFTGNHGWYWRNRGSKDVLIRLITSGEYSRIDAH